MAVDVYEVPNRISKPKGITPDDVETGKVIAATGFHRPARPDFSNATAVIENNSSISEILDYQFKSLPALTNRLTSKFFVQKSPFRWRCDS